MNVIPGSRRATVPVTILTGFLGSGKTTLLNYILTENHGRRIAVIENEFGEVDVDSDLVLTSEENIYQMTNGCICCFIDVRQDLIETVRKLLEQREKFDHIIVETSGLADPTPVATAFFIEEDVAEQVNLDAVVTLVDAMHIEAHLDDPALAGADNQAVDQIVVADRVIVNKIDLVEESQIRNIEGRVRSLNETADIVRSEHARVDLDNILNIDAFVPPPLQPTDDDFLDVKEHLHRHAHDTTVTSVTIRFAEALDENALKPALEEMLGERGEDIFRMKGILNLAGTDRRHVLQGVHRLMDLQPGVPWAGDERTNKIVLIGRNLDADGLEAFFKGCRAETA